MMRVASELARREGGEALVTGDSLGQVSSQTLHNMGVVERARRPARAAPARRLGQGRIVREAQEIGTYAVSALPAEDCCTLFASPLAETRAAPDKLSTLEARLDLAETVAAAHRGRGARSATRRGARSQAILLLPGRFCSRLTLGVSRVDSW